MGKVGKLIVAAVGIAINVIPGLGQAISGAIYGALAGGAVGSLAAAAFTFSQVVVAGAGLYGVATAFSLVASIFAPSAPKPAAAVSQQRSPTPLRTYLAGTRRVYGAVVLFESATDGSSVDVIAYIDGRAQSVSRTYINDDQVTISGGIVQPLTDGAYKDNTVRAGFSLGAATETAFTAVTGALPGIWTSAHRGDGVVCGYLIKQPVKSKEFLTVYPQGDNTVLSLVIDSWHLFDPRETGQDWNDNDTWTGPYDNPILSLLRYLVVDRGEDYDTRIAPVVDYWIAAADICDSARTLKAGGTEKLYRCALLWDASAKPSEVIAEHLKTFDGWMGENDDGHIVVYAGQLYEPTVSIGPAEIIDYEVKNFVESEDRLNEVIITYVSSLHDYSQVEASAWRDESDITDRGIIVSTTFEPQVPSHAQAQHLAPRLAAKTNAPNSGTISTNFSGRSVIGQRYINLDVTEGGHTFYSGLAEVLTIEKSQSGGVVFTWAAVNEALDEWTPASDEGDPAPVGDSPDTDLLDVPEITASSAVVDASAARILITATSPDRGDLTWYLQWRVDGETVWSEQQYGDIAQGTSVDLTSDLVTMDADIEVQVAYSTGDGRFSGWSTTETVSTSTAALAPAPPASFSVFGGSGQADGYWTNPSSASFVDARLYRNTTSNLGTATIVTTRTAAPGSLDSYSDTGLSAGTYYYWLRARNAAGAQSSAVASGPVTVT